MDAVDQGRFLAWAAFHRANPHILALFVRFAREAIAARPGRVGARMIGERIRWATRVEVERTDREVRLNDHLWPYYSRLSMSLFPELRGAFERRDERFDATDAEILAAHKSHAVDRREDCEARGAVP